MGNRRVAFRGAKLALKINDKGGALNEYGRYTAGFSN